MTTAAITITATVLGLVSREYNFKDRSGEKVEGTSHTLHLYDFVASAPHFVKVPESYLGAISELGQGELASFAVDVRARNDQATFTLNAVPTVIGETFALTGTASGAKAS